MEKVILLITLGLLCSCSMMPEKKIYTEIDIDAPVEKVWDVLVDNKNYPSWNPYHVKVEGTLELGAKLNVEIHKPNGQKVEIEPHVMELERNKKLIWGGGISGVFKGVHVFELISLNKNKTTLIHRERFSGIVIPFASLDAIEEGYQLMNEALKRKVEQ